MDTTLNDPMEVETHNKKRPATFSPTKEPPKKIFINKNNNDNKLISSLTNRLDEIFENIKPIGKDATKQIIEIIRKPVLKLFTEALESSRNDASRNFSIVKNNDLASIHDKLNLILNGTKPKNAIPTFSSIVSNIDNPTPTVPPTPTNRSTFTPPPPPLPKKLPKVKPIISKSGPHLIIKDLLPDTQEEKSLLEKIKEVSNPSNLGFNIKGFNNTNKSRVIIHLESEKDCSTLKNNLTNKLDKKRIEISAGIPTLPRVAILGVPKSSDDTEILKSTSSIFNDLPDKKPLSDSLKIIRRTNGNLIVSTAIVECSPDAYTILLKQGRFFINYNRCKLEPAKSTRQCFRCGEFGHNQNSCSKEEICLFCSLSHSSFSCPSKDDKNLHICSNCSRASPNLAKHSALSKNCPFIKQHSNNLIHLDA